MKKHHFGYELELLFDGLLNNIAEIRFDYINFDNIVFLLTEIEDVCSEVLRPEKFSEVAYIISSLKKLTQTETVSASNEYDFGQEKKLYIDIAKELLRISCDKKNQKKVIFFLPYKASMWDSLESIWECAENDKANCIPIVVSLPYFELSATGKPKSFECEMEKYPQNVSVESWEDYPWAKLRKIKPDCIFIHNPYDNTNMVTSVDGQYHSGKLKECTEQLVYVPYYVSEKVTGEIFCQVPGIRNADYIITHDEANRQQFLRFRTENESEEKFQALGSPKIDKVRWPKQTDLAMPANWDKMAKGKKIILYNSSLGDISNNIDKLCTKMKNVFELYRNADDCLLWWRPHPLVEVTLQVKNTYVYNEYMRLKKDFIKGQYGIYDDTSELTRAIICSDIYYGDHSSVAALYRETGKCVIYQDYDCLTREISISDIQMIYQEEENTSSTGADVKAGQKIYEFCMSKLMMENEGV